MTPGDIGHPDVPAVVPATCPHCRAPLRSAARFCRGCGTPVAAGSTAGRPLAPTWRRSANRPQRTLAQRRTRRRRLSIVAIVATLAVAGYTAITRVQDNVDAPDAIVRKLYAALAARDAGGAGQLVGCHTAPLCQPGALATGYQPPEDVTISDVKRNAPADDDPTRRPNRNLVTVTVTYQLLGKRFEDTVQVQRKGVGLQRTWSILAAPRHGLTILSKHLPVARLAAADVPTAQQLPAAGRPDVLEMVWPGTYTLTTPPDHPLYTAAPATVTIATGRLHFIDLRVTVRPGVVDEVTRQVRARIDTCARQRDLHPAIVGAACPFAYNSSFVFTKDPQWTVTGYPAIAVEAADDGTATVRTTNYGHAKVTFAWTLNVLEPKHWTQTDGTVDFTVGGRVDITDDHKLVWSG